MKKEFKGLKDSYSPPKAQRVILKSGLSILTQSSNVTIDEGLEDGGDDW